MLVASFTSSEQSRVSRLLASMAEISHVIDYCSSYAMTIVLIASTIDKFVTSSPDFSC
jgi:hypothetical protein